MDKTCLEQLVEIQGHMDRVMEQVFNTAIDPLNSEFILENLLDAEVIG